MSASSSPEDAQAFYGRWARLYDYLARFTPGIASLRRRAAAACRLEPGDTVVEMGCGTGANLPFLAEAVGTDGSVLGIDFTRPVLERAREPTADVENVHLVRGDATEPPVADDVDAVLATFVAGMLPEPAAAVADWCDLVSPGGHVVLVNAARSRQPYAPPINALFRAVVVLSTPPTTKLRYEDDPTRRLDARITAAHDRLRDRADAIADERHALGVVRLTGGRIP
ncbi:class I SAM-dependent methyltransferase [Natrialbaceae archaeon AArc-T1-2]|uniref:class I SAM-dependent methyltransferase n=1 Tax=Natrialbaceae archaeon AArc-T1-2 TaxID=3053904 RepID=UPI00255B1F51|nr:methyltransferase domain-containing protein [Natrialbaceae archaeon AArc-T1-2]WIV67090.1 methyltransferase domain-containing protein [Natrialbaceae archaeon AArc-T1-2]